MMDFFDKINEKYKKGGRSTKHERDLFKKHYETFLGKKIFKDSNFSDREGKVHNEYGWILNEMIKQNMDNKERQEYRTQHPNLRKQLSHKLSSSAKHLQITPRTPRGKMGNIFKFGNKMYGVDGPLGYPPVLKATGYRNCWN